MPSDIPAVSELDDKALVAAHVAGDPDAFGELVRRHRDRLWAVALRTLGDPEEAADAVQDALISAFRRADSYRGDAAVTTWLHRIVVNACLDRVRRRQARPAVALPDDLDDRPEVASSRDQQDEALVALDVQAALDTLPIEQRSAIVLVDVLGHSVDDAARILGCPAGTVKSRCSRGRTRLLPLLAHLRNPEATPGVVPGVGDTPANSSADLGQGTTDPSAASPGPTRPPAEASGGEPA
jgi:RNA polymerase sigma-70 factor (ECF subfamily)